MDRVLFFNYNSLKISILIIIVELSMELLKLTFMALLLSFSLEEH